MINHRFQHSPLSIWWCLITNYDCRPHVGPSIHSSRPKSTELLIWPSNGVAISEPNFSSSITKISMIFCWTLRVISMRICWKSIDHLRNQQFATAIYLLFLACHLPKKISGDYLDQSRYEFTIDIGDSFTNFEDKYGFFIKPLPSSYNKIYIGMSENHELKIVQSRSRIMICTWHRFQFGKSHSIYY